MDVCFDLLIPKAVLNNEALLDQMLLKEQLVSWGGEARLQQDPRKFCWNGAVKFTLIETPNGIVPFLTGKIDVHEMACLSLRGGSLAIWEAAINAHDADAPAEIPLRVLLESCLAQVDQWVVSFDVNCEQIDYVISSYPTDLIARIEHSLTWSNEQLGFVAWSAPSALR